MKCFFQMVLEGEHIEEYGSENVTLSKTLHEFLTELSFEVFLTITNCVLIGNKGKEVDSRFTASMNNTHIYIPQDIFDQLFRTKQQ